MPRAGLGSHESRCRGGLEPAQPKVRHLDRHGVVDEEVQRFQVPVNDYGLGLVQDCRQAPMHAGMSRMHHQHTVQSSAIHLQFMPLAASSAMRTRCTHGSVAEVCSNANRFPRPQYSVTMHRGSSTNPMNNTMLGCLSRVIIVISLRNADTACSRAASGWWRSLLTATSVPRYLCTIPPVSTQRHLTGRKEAARTLL